MENNKTTKECCEECKVPPHKQDEYGQTCYNTACPCHIPEDNNADEWEQELRGVFDLSGKDPEATLKAIAKVTSDLLAKERESVIELIERLKEKCEHSDNCLCAICIHNQALDELAEKIKSK